MAEIVDGLKITVGKVVEITEIGPDIGTEFDKTIQHLLKEIRKNQIPDEVEDLSFSVKCLCEGVKLLRG